MKHPRTRAERRANQQAVDAVTQRMMAEWGFTGTWHKFRRQRQPCSCLSCGNLRSWEGPTMQERHQQLKLHEGLDEVFLGPEDERAHVEWERAEQEALMNEYQHVLRAALDFACRRIDYYEEGQSYYESDAVWRDADNNTVAFSEWSGIGVLPERHDFVWNVFKMFM